MKYLLATVGFIVVAVVVALTLVYGMSTVIVTSDFLSSGWTTKKLGNWPKKAFAVIPLLSLTGAGFCSVYF